jgi:hypothetical protein
MRERNWSTEGSISMAANDVIGSCLVLASLAPFPGGWEWDIRVDLASKPERSRKSPVTPGQASTGLTLQRNHRLPGEQGGHMSVIP